MPICRRPRAAGTRRAARRPRRARELDRRRRQLERVGEALRRAGSALAGPRRPSSSRASSAARSASRRRCSASARARAPRRRASRHHRDDRKTRQRDPVLGVGDREPAGRRDVEEVERERRRERRDDPEPQRPRRSRRAAPRPGRATPSETAGATSLSGIDQRGRERDRGDGGGDAEAMRGRVGGSSRAERRAAMPLRLLARQCSSIEAAGASSIVTAGARVARRGALLAQHDRRPRAAGVELRARARRRARAGRSRRARRPRRRRSRSASCALSRLARAA